MVQRFGRTGRAGAGKIIVMIQRGEEEKKYKMSKVNSKKIMDRLKQASKSRLPSRTANLGHPTSSSNGGQSTLNFGQL